MGLDREQTEAYLARLGLAPGQVAADLDGLTALHERHLLTVPFENLSIHLGEPVVLDVDLLVDKIVGRRRGGFCYELNGAFAALLRSLGFRVDLLEARVAAGTMPFDHLCLRVRADGVDHLADVGFGASFRRPLRFVLDEPQHDPEGVFQLVGTDDGRIVLLRDGEAQFRFGTAPYELADFAGGCRHHTTSPDSHFTRSTVCTRATPDGRVTISGRTLRTTTGGRVVEREVDDDAELLALHRHHLGVELDRVPTALHGG